MTFQFQRPLVLWFSALPAGLNSRLTSCKIVHDSEDCRTLHKRLSAATVCNRKIRCDASIRPASTRSLSHSRLSEFCRNTPHMLHAVWDAIHRSLDEINEPAPLPSIGISELHIFPEIASFVPSCHRWTIVRAMYRSSIAGI